MTTKVNISLAQKHLPVIIEVLGVNGAVQFVYTLTTLDQQFSDYVHGGQSIRVREMTTAELRETQSSIDDPPACSGCGAMVGVCLDYPNCAGGS